MDTSVTAISVKIFLILIKFVVSKWFIMFFLKNFSKLVIPKEKMLTYYICLKFINLLNPKILLLSLHFFQCFLE